MEDMLMTILKSLVELAIVLLTPYAIKALLALENYAVKKAGLSNYNLAKSFLEDLIKVRPNLFTEENLVDLIDKLDNKFGDHLSVDDIKILVDSAMADINKEVQIVGQSDSADTVTIADTVEEKSDTTSNSVAPIENSQTSN